MSDDASALSASTTNPISVAFIVFISNSTGLSLSTLEIVYDFVWNPACPV